MQEKTNQERILGSLLESSKTTAELANELGYIDSEGVPRYNIIHRDLKKLTAYGYIESKREKLDKKLGNTPTLYSLLYNIQCLKKILEEYPNLIENMQGSELALEIIVQEYYSPINTSTKEEWMQIENMVRQEKINKGLFKKKRTSSGEAWVQINNMLMKEQMDKELCKKKVRWSKEFFRFCLTNTMDELVEKAKKLAQISDGYLETAVFKSEFIPTSPVPLRTRNRMINLIFEKCVAFDIIKGQTTWEEVEYLKGRKDDKLYDPYDS